MARPTARQRGYGAAWDRARAEHLAAHPWCAACEQAGKLVRAAHVHHTTPHRGNMAVFWDRSKWQSLCTEHHNRDAQQVERRGYANRVAADGMPMDKSHPFYAGQYDSPEEVNARPGPSSADPVTIGERTSIKRAKAGGSKAAGRKGAGPSGYLPSQLVSAIDRSGGR